MALGIDRWVYEVEITSSNNTIVFVERDAGGTLTATVTVDPGTYHCVLDTGLVPAQIDGLYNEIEQAVGAGAELPGAGSYSLERIDPTASANTFGKKSGLRLAYSDTDLDEFGWVFSDANFTFPPELLGYLDGRSSDATTTAQQLDAPHTCWGTWTSPRVAKKVGWPRFEQRHTGVSFSQFVNVRWGSQKLRRPFKYHNLPAVHIHRGRASRDAYAEVGQLADDDDNNAFEDVWRAMSDGGEALVFHDHGDTVDDFANQDEWELVRFPDEVLAGDIDFRDVPTEQSRSAEFYTLDFEVEVDTTLSPYTY